MDRAETIDHEYTTPTAQVPSTHRTDDQNKHLSDNYTLLKVTL